MKVSIIVAVSNNRIIGKDNQIPWYLPADLRYFKKVTLNHHIIMGRKSFESIGKPLPKRTNIVLTRNPFFIATGIIATNSIENAINIAKKNGENEVFIIGGEAIFRYSYSYWDRIYLTKVDLIVEGDVFFPEIDFSEWQLISKEDHLADDKNPYSYSFQIYDKK